MPGLNQGALLQSAGTSAPVLYRMVASILEHDGRRGGTIVDVGCGTGLLRNSVGSLFERYIGIDGAVHESSRDNGRLILANLDDGIPLASDAADAVVAIETIEHLENPWQFVRELARITAPGGCIIVTTPNQLSALSKVTLMLKHRFNAFQDSAYPAHRTALLEVDLRRMFEASGLRGGRVCYTHQGRIPGTAAHYPVALANILPRAMSDNLLMVARKP